MNVSKKVLAVIVIAVAMGACNNSGVETANSASADSAAKMAPDSVKAASTSDSTMKKTDSTAAAATDTTKKM